MDELKANQPKLNGPDRRAKWADIIAKPSVDWYQDVLKRKNTFVNGDGFVHKEYFWAPDWGLSPA